MGTPSPDNLLLIGRVVRTHGLQGECKVIPETDNPDRLRSLDRIWLGKTPKIVRSYDIQSTRLQYSKRGATILMQFAGIHTVNDAKELGRPHVFAHVDDLPPLKPGEFFLHDLIGANVVTDEGESVGTLKDVWDTQGHALYLIERPGQKEAFIPVVPEFIVSTDVKNRCMVVRTVEGLLD